MSNDLAPKLRHITDIAIANKWKMSDFVNTVFQSVFAVIIITRFCCLVAI